jgi:adenosylcobinamide kinase / adenosylcobinamide-phosphate guanylyltransferase
VITLVLGGARSGKSEVAESLLGDDATYVATGAPGDEGTDPAWAVRVERHRARRPPSWTTVETTDLAAVVRTLDGDVLVDSLGTWVAAAPGFAVDAGELCDALRARAARTVVVSDEVGLGVHPPTAVGVAFRDALGDVNRAVADVADEVLLVVAGRVLTL